MHYIDSSTFELNTLANLFLQPKKISEYLVTQEDFGAIRYRKLFEKLTELVEEDFGGEDNSFWIKEAGRRSNQPIEDLLEAEDWALEFNLSQVRLARKQEQIKALAIRVDELTDEEIDTTLRGFFKQKVSEQSGTDAAEFLKGEYRTYLASRKNKKSGIYTGFNKFDGNIGMERKQLVTLAARPSVGKSALALNLGYGAAHYGFKVFYASLEMGKEELMNRLCAGIAGISSTRFKYGNVDEATLLKCQMELKDVEGRLWIEEMSGVTVDKILNRADAKRVKTGLDVLILDHIDLVQISNAKESEAYAIAKMTSALKAYAVENNCLVICLSQFNRESKGDMPELHQLRGSGAKEQDSDVVLILHRDLDPDGEGFKTAKLRIAKNRNGQVGDIPLRFQPETTTFTEI